MRFPAHVLTLAMAMPASFACNAAPPPGDPPPLYALTFQGPDSSGRIVFSGGVPDTDRDDHKGRYIGAVQSYTIQLSGTLSSSASPTVETFQGNSGSLVLGFQADGIGACGFASDCLAFIFDTLHFPARPHDPFVNIQFDYPVGTFTNDGLPTSLGPLAGQSIFMSYARQWNLNGPITQISAVPDAPSMALLIAGLCVLGAAARRRA